MVQFTSLVIHRLSQMRAAVFTSRIDGSQGIVFVWLFVLGMYVITIPFYIRFLNSVVPAGDPHTYTVGFFQIIDESRANYWAPFETILIRNWYWLLNGSIALLSPILVKEPFSLALVNFLIFGLATTGFFRLSRSLGFDSVTSFVLSMLIWIYPVNYGFATYESIPVMALDAMFNGVLYLAVAGVMIYVLDAASGWKAVFAGVVVGLAVWGRGNSLPVVAMVVSFPTAVLLYDLWRRRSWPVLRNFLLYSAIAVLFAAVFYSIQWGPITAYYTDYLHFIERHPWTFQDAKVWIYNIPGFMFWRDENSVATISLTVLGHLVPLWSLWYTSRNLKLTWERRPSSPTAFIILSVTGAIIYYMTYITNLTLWTDPHMSIYNVLLIYRPMLIGMSLSLVAALGVAFIKYSVGFTNATAAVVMVAILIYGIVFTKLQTPAADGEPTPRQVEQFALGVDDLLQGGALSVLWFGRYNPRIFDYYRLKNDLGSIPIYMNKYFNNMWSQVDYSEENRERVKFELRMQFEEASAIIIPEYSSSYLGPYAFYRFRDEIVTYLNSPDSPRFRIMRRLDDRPGLRLLVLKREQDVGNRGEPLPLPYGPEFAATNSTAGGLFLGTNPDSVALFGVTVMQNKVLAPNGQPSGALMVEQATQAAAHLLSVRYDGRGTGISAAAWLKYAGREVLRLQVSDVPGQRGVIVDGQYVEGQLRFNPAVTLGTARNARAVVRDERDGWYQVELNAELGEPVDSAVVQIILGNALDVSPYDGDGKSGLMVWGITYEATMLPSGTRDRPGTSGNSAAGRPQ